MNQLISTAEGCHGKMEVYQKPSALYNFTTLYFKYGLTVNKTSERDKEKKLKKTTTKG